jgi:hypothetical protein
LGIIAKNPVFGTDATVVLGKVKADVELPVHCASY